MAGGAVSDPLTTVLAKSARRGRAGKPELLTTHSEAVRNAVRVLAARIGPAGVLKSVPRFWTWAEQAGLLHDAGKIATGFQDQLAPDGSIWGHRHELLSLGFVDALLADVEPEHRMLVAAGVAFHHRPLASFTSTRTLIHQCPDDWERDFGDTVAPPAIVEVFLAWFAAELGIPSPVPDGAPLWKRARDCFEALEVRWEETDDESGLVAVLMQGAVTLADRSASAHISLHRHLPLSTDYLDQLAAPYPHQREAGDVTGHLVLHAPTGSGKTEAGLAWAARQIATMPGEPRVIWTLPYRASINAIADRFRRSLPPLPGQSEADVGILHGKVAQTLLNRACEDDRAPDREAAVKAGAEANAARLMMHRLRVSTPYQLLRGMIAGPNCSSLLLEQANAVFVCDELHAYDPETFGRICATMRLWKRLGSRVAVLSATLAPQLVTLIEESLGEPVQSVHAPPETALARHRVVADPQPVDAAESLDRIQSWLEAGHSVLVVANTVGTAQRLYETLAPTAQAAAPDDPDAAILLHSRFRGRDRAAIEHRLLQRHPERAECEPAHRRGGLVVATQTVEVSLCLDFDRGATEIAPVESVVQRMGRVNRRGRHPDGRVEVRVHRVDSPRPYRSDMVDTAWEIIAGHQAEALSEQDLAAWLALAYDSPSGQQWLAQARQARDAFTEGFLNFTMPFEDRSEFAKQLDEQFDTVEVLRHEDVPTYRDALYGPNGHHLLAADLLIPIRYAQMKPLGCRMDPELGVPVMAPGIPYDPLLGLAIPSRRDAPPVETVL
jgi:CRISPR-associated endonuclease/helicase Cas3